MTAAVLPRARIQQRLLVVHGDTGRVNDHTFDDIVHLFGPGDVLVVNDAATLPASLPVILGGVHGEARLVGPPEDGWVVLFGAGSWRQPTEARSAPPEVRVGECIEVAGSERVVREVSPISPRLVRIDLTLAEVMEHGRPVQYSYVPRPLRLDEVQTPYAGRPWATEMPSAGRVLTPSLVTALRERGVTVVALTHAAGLSSTGDPALDHALPLAERYHVPPATWRAVQSAEPVKSRLPETSMIGRLAKSSTDRDRL